jgi:uncharacterized paraquat-inducible protein A
MWGNIGTNMLKTYVALSEQDIDAEFREKMGLKKKEVKEEKKMAPRQCKSCFAMNGPQSNFCHVCGKPLTDRAQQDVEHSTDTLRKLLAENPAAQTELLELLKSMKIKPT